MNATSAAVAAPQALSLQVRSDGVAIVTYDVPGEPVNTLKASFAEEFARVFGRIASDPAIVAAVLISGKPDGFIAGADITMFESIHSAAQAEALVRKGHQAIRQLAECPKPVVAAIHGPALGGGFEVALACRGRVLSDDRKTVLGWPEVQLGLLPALNGLQRLAAMTDIATALDYGATGKHMRASKARALGIVDDIVPLSILKDVAVRLAQKLAEKGVGARKPKRKRIDIDSLARTALEKTPVGRVIFFKKARAELVKKTGGHYPAPERILDVLQVFAKKGFEASRETEAKAFGELVMGDTARRLIELFFATTALKKDTGVEDETAAPRKVEKIVVLGAGLMGAGIAHASIQAGIAVRMKDRDDAALGRGLKQIVEILDGRVKKKQLSRIERDRTLALLTTATEYSGMAGAGLVIEAVFEDLAVKHAVLKEVEAACPEGVIFASNTSSIPIRKIAAAARRPEHVVGMHYFSPVHRMPLLEVIRTPEASAEVVATAVAVGKKQGKTVIVVNDGVGFYTSRILSPYMNEASWLLFEGVPVETIDKALVAWGFPVGPITLLDEVGIDVAAHVGPIMAEAFGDRIDPPPALGKLLEDDRRGRKNERGFYLYGKRAESRGKGKHVDEAVYHALGLPVPDPRAKSPLAVEEIQMRCALQLIHEAIYCLGEGILRSARDGDVGAVFGLGFPPFRGGPLRYVDALGADEILRRIEGYHQRFGSRWKPAPMLLEFAKSRKRFYG